MEGVEDEEARKQGGDSVAHRKPGKGRTKGGWEGGETPEKREKEDQRESGMTGKREREREDLLWIVICHVHPLACGDTRVWLLILNRC